MSEIEKIIHAVRGMLALELGTGPVRKPPSLGEPAKRPPFQPEPHRQQVKTLREREKRKAETDPASVGWISITASKKRAKARKQAIAGQGRIRNRKDIGGINCEKKATECKCTKRSERKC